METGEILLGISIALIAGLISNRLIKLINLPNVTGYLLVGIYLDHISLVYLMII